MKAMRQPSRKIVVLVLAFIMLLALGLRLWGIEYGLPFTMARPDEERIAHRAFIMAIDGDWHPGDFMYPGLLKNIDVLVLRAYVRCGRLTGRYESFDDFVFDMEVTRPYHHYLICRVVSAAFGALTIPIVYLLASFSARDRWIGLLAAWLAAVCFLHARDSHFATVDVTATFFATASVLFAVRLARQCRTSDLLLAGFFAGLSAAAKYNVGAVGVATAIAVLLSNPDWKGARGVARAIGRLMSAALAAFGAFALASPYSLLRYNETIEWLSFVNSAIKSGTAAPAALSHLTETFPAGLGYLFCAAAVVGIGAAVFKRERHHVVILGYLIVFYASIGGVRWVVPRYVLPIVPVLAALAAEGALSLPWCRSAYGALLGAVILGGQSLSASIQYDRLASRKDTRVQAMEWIARNIPGRTKIAACVGAGSPEINVDARRGPAYRPSSYKCDYPTLAGLERPFLLTHEHPMLGWSRPKGYFDRLAGTGWIQAAVFDPFIAQSAAKAVFSGGDAFYLPFAGFSAVDRGGPIVRIWRRKTANSPVTPDREAGVAPRASGSP